MLTSRELLPNASILGERNCSCPYNIPANLRFLCLQSNSPIKFNVLNHRITILNFFDELFRWQKKRKLAGMKMHIVLQG